MRKINAFIFLTVNGHFKGPDGDISWHVHGAEGNEFSESQLQAGHILLFGRKTYEMMRSFWPTELAYDSFPEVAESMNHAEKIVLSNSLTRADWQHTTIISGDSIGQLRQLKLSRGKDITILGSGSVVTQLTDAGLIDEYQLWIDPVATGTGTSLFEDLKIRLDLVLTDSKVFKKSNAVLLTYKRK